MARTQFYAEQPLPIGRVVKGDFYTARDKDSDGVPYTVKEGPNAGKPNPQFYYAVAIPKTAGAAHWAHEKWGTPIWAIGNSCFPKIAESPTFSWKIIDGDSATPNKKGNVPRDQEGYPGHWIVAFNSSLAPRLVASDGATPLLEPGVAMAGDYVQVFIGVDGNSSQKNPGVYVNGIYVRYVGPSAKGRIVQGRDPSTIDWGGHAAPTDLSATPVAASGAPAAPAALPRPALPVALPAGLPGAVTPPPGPLPAPLAVVPAPGFLAPLPAPPAPPAAPAHQLTAKAQGATYEALIGAGWTDATLIQHGVMLA